MQRCAETHRHGRTASVRACVQSVDNKRIIFIDFPAALEKGHKVHKSAQRCLEDKKKGVCGVAVGVIGVSSAPDPGDVLCLCLLSAPSASPVAVCG